MQNILPPGVLRFEVAQHKNKLNHDQLPGFANSYQILHVLRHEKRFSTLYGITLIYYLLSWIIMV